MSKRKQTPGFAATLAELEAVTSRLESDSLSLEDTLNDFEKGVQLIREAQKSLLEAQQKVQLLIDENGEPVAAALKSDEDAV